MVMTTLQIEQGSALRKAIIDNPTDDTLRLVYADWLEEYGDQSYTTSARINMLRGTERNTKLKEPWYKVLPEHADFIHSEGLEVWIDGDRWRYANRVGPIISDTIPYLKYRRGFLSEVGLSEGAWIKYGKRFAQDPLEKVVLLGKHPYTVSSTIETHYYWRYRSADTMLREGTLDQSIFYLLREGAGDYDTLTCSRYNQSLSFQYDTLKEAFQALSAACIKYSRQKGT